MLSSLSPPLSRRSFLAGSGALLGLSAPSLIRAQTRQLSVGAFGGYFNDAFVASIYPAFTAATGIEVVPVAQPTAEIWLVQILGAGRAGKSPADVSMLSGVSLQQAIRQDALQSFDTSLLPNLANLDEAFIARDATEAIKGIGAVAWYTTLVTNTDTYPQAPDSWTALWDPANAGRIAALALPTSSFLLEITAKTYFPSETGILDSRDGIETIFAKLTEMVPSVRLWYRDDAQFQQLLADGEIPMGQFYHDVTELAAKDGARVRSTFPKEGGVVDFGSWVMPKAVTAVGEVHAFVDFISDAATQSLLSRSVSTAPVIPRQLTDLSEAEFMAVSSDIPPIVPRHDIYGTDGTWIADRWAEIIAG
jgi:putative spermidine/putrescine transport system substrate-binding protein